MKHIKLFEHWVESIVESNGDIERTLPNMLTTNQVSDDNWDSNWSDSIEDDDDESFDKTEVEDYPDDEWDSNWSDS